MPTVRRLIALNLHPAISQFVTFIEGQVGRHRKKQRPTGRISKLDVYGIRAKAAAAQARRSAQQDDDDWDGGGRSPNDDRSDSMNPNNDSYQASADNRSDQMNPNNDAYGSSRR